MVFFNGLNHSLNQPTVVINYEMASAKIYYDDYTNHTCGDVPLVTHTPVTHTAGMSLWQPILRPVT